MGEKALISAQKLFSCQTQGATAKQSAPNSKAFCPMISEPVPATEIEKYPFS